MKKNSSSASGFINTRNLVGVFLCLSGVSLAMLSFAATPSKQKVAPKQQTAANLQPVHGPAAPVTPSAPTPTGGTLTSSIRQVNALTYADSVGSSANLTFFAGSGTCAVPTSCGTYALHIDPSVGTAVAGYDPTKFLIFIELSWAQATVDYDTWVCSGAGNCVQANVIASNASTAEPEVIFLPTSLASGDYTINAVNATGAPVPYNGTVYLQPIPAATSCPTCPVPRYQTYYANVPTPNGAGEPSIGVDWNPNVPSLKVTAPGNTAHGPTLQNTGGVTFFQASFNTLRVDFDDCASPAITTWTDKTPSTLVLSLDPIGFVDHFSSVALGIAYPPPVTPGRVFNFQLNAGNSEEAFSDNDGNSYTPGEGGSPPAGPDHEAFGGGPYSTQGTGGVVPPHPTYANATYYCSQNIAAEAECSRSDNGGLTFGPGVPIYNPTQCLGSIHGHPKVAPNGTVYVPNSSCGFGGAAGVAISLDNGITWNASGVPGSTGSLDPSVGIGQNNVGKPVGGTIPASGNTVYLGWISGDGSPHIAHSKNQGLTWLDDTNVGASVVNVDGTTGIRHSVFPAVVAGDDNRAAFGFLGTGPAIDSGGTCDPLGTGNCANIWHAYVATTYDGGANWTTVDTTPNKAVQKGVICTQGTTCAAGRNLLDFNGFDVDSQGRGLFGYADGVGATGNNTFDGQSGGALSTIARQSGGKRLFSFFDILEPHAPAAPQAVSANRVTSPAGILVTWLEPDSGGATIAGYRIYRGTASGGENIVTPVGTTTGETSTQFLDTTVLPTGNYFYHITAVNASGESAFCNEPGIVVTNMGNKCVVPGLPELTDPSGDTSAALGIISTPAPPGADLKSFEIAQPYQTDCSAMKLVFTITTWDNGQTPQPTGSAWYVAFKIGANYKGVHMAWNPTTPTTPTFESYTPGANTSGGVDGRFVTPGSQKPAEASSSYASPFNQVVIVVKASDLGLNPGDTISGFVSGVSQSTDPGALVGAGATALYDMMPDSLAFTGTYTVGGIQDCRINNPPVPFMTATPMSGVAPLAVNFDASGSSDPDTACIADTIASYTLNFGDGTAPVTQASPLFSHTYNGNGDFPARLTVTDSRGLASINNFQLVISVGSTFTKAVSRKFHPAFGNGDINLPLVGGPRGVECRSTGNGAYTIVYSFLRNITAVDSATVTQGTGTIDTANSMLGPLANQYTVALTGVTNAQYLHVQLDGVHDIVGAVINAALARVGILFGDVNASGRVDGTDVSLIRGQNFQTLTGDPTNTFREDINVSGRIDGTDVSFARGQNFTVLPSLP